MIPAAQREAEVVNTLGGEKLELMMSPNPEDMIHIMSLLTNMYSDNEGACIREYSTNAWDAQIENGVFEPIVVTTPTLLDPYLRIKDKGCGISAERFRDMWRIYGASSKRTKADQNGSMGIGAKSALAYTNQFSIISVCDGMKVHVSISRTEMGGSSAEIVLHAPTDEPSGTEIVIPTARHHQFDKKAHKFFRYWEKGMVLLNGQDPSRRDELIKVTDRLYQNPFSDDDVIFMGNVAYPVNESIGMLRKSGHGVIAFVTMAGDDQVKFSPSRESLIYNDQTNYVVKSLKEEYDNHILSTLQDEIDKCETHAEAMRKKIEINNDYYRYNETIHPLTYKGEVIPSVSQKVSYLEAIPFKPRETCICWTPGRSRNVVQAHKAVWSNVSHVVYNYVPSGNASSEHRRKVSTYIIDNFGGSLSGWKVVVFAKISDPTKFDGYKWNDDKFIDWEEIKKIRFESARSANKDVNDWQIQTDGYGSVDVVKTLKKDDKIIYWSSARDRDIDYTRYEMLTRYYKGAILMREPMNRHTRIKREFPNAITLSEAMEAIRKKVLKAGVPAEDKMLYSAKNLRHAEQVNRVRQYGEIKDKYLLELVKARDKVYNSGFTAYSQRTKDMITLQGESNTFAGVDMVDRDYIDNNYPLVPVISTYNITSSEVRKDVIDYINMKYEMRNKG